MSDAVKLLPCPFCGDTPTFIEAGWNGIAETGPWAICESSHACPLFKRDTELTTWNQRAASPASLAAPRNARTQTRDRLVNGVCRDNSHVWTVENPLDVPANDQHCDCGKAIWNPGNANAAAPPQDVTDEGPLKGEPVGTVASLRRVLSRFAGEAQVLCQVVAKDGTVWNVFADATNGRDVGFKWDVAPLILTLTHPELATLPKGVNEPAGLPDGSATTARRELLGDFNGWLRGELAHIDDHRDPAEPDVHLLLALVAGIASRMRQKHQELQAAEYETWPENFAVHAMRLASKESGDAR